MLINRVCRALTSHKVKYAVVGGYAMALHGAVRGTIDVDLIINIRQNDFLNAEKAMQSIGLQSRLPVTGREVFKFRDEYIKNRNLIAWSFLNPKNPMDIVDIVITTDLKTVDVTKVKVGQETITILSIKDLIKMKKKSDRPQDKADMEALQKIMKEKP